MGKGFLIEQNGDICHGIYKDDIQDGEGTYQHEMQDTDGSATGYIYHGQRQYQYSNGYGMQLWANGDAYIGEWLYNKMHGTGYWITVDKKNPFNLKFAKAIFQNGEIEELNYKLKNYEISQQLYKYKQLEDKKSLIHLDIEQIRNTQRQLAYEYLLIPPTVAEENSEGPGDTQQTQRQKAPK